MWWPASWPVSFRMACFLACYPPSVPANFSGFKMRYYLINLECLSILINGEEWAVVASDATLPDWGASKYCRVLQKEPFLRFLSPIGWGYALGFALGDIWQCHEWGLGHVGGCWWPLPKQKGIATAGCCSAAGGCCPFWGRCLGGNLAWGLSVVWGGP